VNLHPEIQKALSLPMIHHRTPAFDQILTRVLLKMKSIFKTQQDVFLLSSTGSGGMEALLINTIAPKDKVLAIVSGKFGERWADMAEVFGADVHRMVVPWGESANIEKVSEFLNQHPDTQMVLCQACETSTGVLHPIQQLGELTKNLHTLLLVDGITALGALPLPMDEWHIDGLVGGSQKAFMLPTGMSFVSLSEKAWKKKKSSKLNPHFYFDLAKEKDANSKGETYFSSNVSLIRCLDLVLDLILKDSLENLFATISRRAQFTRHFGIQLGLKIFPKVPSNSLTTLLLPAELDGQKIRSDLESQYNITIMGGQDQLKGKILRVGHMGYISDADLMRWLQATFLTLKEHSKNSFTLSWETLETEAQLWLKKN
jgi:aspartate aminotransferase-like enzyme